MTDTMILVNAWHPLPLDWEPEDLVSLWQQPDRHVLLPLRPERLVRCAYRAADGLFAAAMEAGFDDLVLQSAYRDAERQARLFEQDPSGMTARPGCSEHQTGLAMDVALLGGHLVEEPDHVRWLHEHCWDHGFVVRYPAGREETTGIPAEPWHLRYVGREAAQEMRARGWVLEDWHAHRGRPAS